MKQDELNLTNDPYETERGCPTLTVFAGSIQHMIPYHSFLGGNYLKDAIRLKFQEGELVVTGKFLDDLWSEFQLQDVRVLRCNQTEEAGDVSITCLEWNQSD
ncbi:MAG: hypothetical protein ACSHYA_18525 [Opitutaceae bacterium]